MAVPTWGKWLIGCAGVVLLVVIGLAALVASKVSSAERTWEASASVEIAAPADVIRSMLDSPKRWGEWSTWARDVDEGVLREFSGPDAGAGAELRWSSGESVRVRVGMKTWTQTGTDVSNVGAGVVRILSSSPERIEVETKFLDRVVFAQRSQDLRSSSTLELNVPGLPLPLRGVIRIEPRGELCVVTWDESGEFGSGLAAALSAMALRSLAKSSHEELLQTSLERLKSVLEAR